MHLEIKMFLLKSMVKIALKISENGYREVSRAGFYQPLRVKLKDRKEEKL